jgi:hypothetical protein
MKSAIALAMMVTMVPLAARAQTTVEPGAAQLRRHDQINLFEGTLVGAVNLAARHVAGEVQAHTSNANFFTGDARAKGFILDGYGVFVYVEIPALDLTLTLMADQIERDARNRAAEANPVSNTVDPNDKLDPKTVAPKVDSKMIGNGPTARETLQAVMDTGQKYRNEVKLTLTDAMLDFSKNLELKPDEWLSVAARGSEGALTPGEILQLTTVVLRVKGSDLADYLAGRLTKEEARKKVEVRQF